MIWGVVVVNNIKNYWSSVNSSSHRRSEPIFYEKNVKEHLSAMDPEDINLEIIDLGCGAGVLLEHYINATRVVVGLDFSSSMIAAAKDRIGNKVDLVNADIFEYLPKCSIPVWMTTEGLNQYLTDSEIRRLIAIFKNNENAKSFYLFETICPIRFPLMNFGLSYRNESWITKSYYGGLKICLLRFKYALKLLFGGFEKGAHYLGTPRMGYAYTPRFWHVLAQEFGLNVEILGSKYYEYRYHVVLKKD